MLRRFTSLPRVLTKVTFPHQTTRAMASSFSGKKDFLCIIPDKPDALERRLKIRPYVNPTPLLLLF